MPIGMSPSWGVMLRPWYFGHSDSIGDRPDRIRPLRLVLPDRLPLDGFGEREPARTSASRPLRGSGSTNAVRSATSFAVVSCLNWSAIDRTARCACPATRRGRRWRRRSRAVHDGRRAASRVGALARSTPSSPGRSTAARARDLGLRPRAPAGGRDRRGGRSRRGAASLARARSRSRLVPSRRA